MGYLFKNKFRRGRKETSLLIYRQKIVFQQQKDIFYCTIKIKGNFKMTKKIFILPILASSLFATPSYEVALTIGKQEFHNPAIVAYERIYGIRGSIINDKLYEYGYGLQIGYEWSNKINCKDLSVGRAYTNFLIQTKDFYSLKPYFIMGLGHEGLNQNIDSEPSQNIFQYGVGAKYFFRQNINIFVETKAIKKFKTKDSDHITNIGIAYLFDRNRKREHYQPSSFTIKEELPIIDLSHTVNSSIVEEKIILKRPQQIVATPKNYNNSISIDKNYYIQMAAYASTNPNRLKNQIRHRGYSNIKLHTVYRKNRPLTLILVGPYSSHKSASKHLRDLKKLKRGAFIYKM